MGNISRRSFLKDTALASAALIAAPSILSCGPAEGKKKKTYGANDKVDLAVIGIGNRGNEDVHYFVETGLCNIVALCDVDMGAPHTQEVMEMFPDAPRFKDWRKMFDKMANKIDAVLIATPDHSHFVIAMAAMKLGIHVYVEKPLARTFAECERLM